MNTYKKLNFCMNLARICRNLSSTRKEPANYYEVLELKPTASQNEIKESFFKKTKLYHPDVVGSTDANLRKFRLISEAYEVLGSPVAKKEYDEKVLGIVKKDIYDEDVIEEYKKRMLQKRNEELHGWTKNYANEMRIADRKGTPNKYDSADNHRVTKLIVSILLILILYIGNDSDQVADLLQKFHS